MPCKCDLLEEAAILFPVFTMRQPTGIGALSPCDAGRFPLSSAIR